MMQFPYQDEPLNGPPPPTLPPAATLRWRPLIPVSIVGPTGKRRYFPRALLDTGADDTVFPLAVLGLIGVAPRRESGHGLRWRGQAFPLRFADVTFELSDHFQVWQWSAVAGFSQAPLRYPILGLCGCLQFFDARFLGASRLVELETNRSYPGTSA
jgi:hypothetical protein